MLPPNRVLGFDPPRAAPLVPPTHEEAAPKDRRGAVVAFAARVLERGVRPLAGELAVTKRRSAGEGHTQARRRGEVRVLLDVALRSQKRLLLLESLKNRVSASSESVRVAR